MPALGLIQHHQVYRLGLPCTPKPPRAELQDILVDKWNNILRHTHMHILKTLKWFHRECISQLEADLQNKITSITTTLCEEEATAILQRGTTIHKHSFERFQSRCRRKLDRILPRTRRQTAVRRQHARRCNSRNQLPEEPVPSTVINLSGSQLSDAEMALLSKGLSFCPTPPSVNTEQLRDDFERFFRRIRLKEFFSDRASEEDLHPFKPPSTCTCTWMPPRGRNVALEVYIRTV